MFVDLTRECVSLGEGFHRVLAILPPPPTEPSSSAKWACNSMQSPKVKILLRSKAQWDLSLGLYLGSVPCGVPCRKDFHRALEEGEEHCKCLFRRLGKSLTGETRLFSVVK